MGLLTSTQFHTLIRIMHGVHKKMKKTNKHKKMIVKTEWQGYIDLLKSQQQRSVRSALILIT
jgi:hypothetical protein